MRDHSAEIEQRAELRRAELRRETLRAELARHDRHTAVRLFSMTISGAFERGEIVDYVAAREAERAEIVADIDELSAGMA